MPHPSVDLRPYEGNFLFNFFFRKLILLRIFLKFSRKLILLRIFFFLPGSCAHRISQCAQKGGRDEQLRQESYEGILCQNFLNSRKRILPTIKYFSQERYEGILCQNFVNSRKRSLPSIKYFSLRHYEGNFLFKNFA